MKKIIFTLVLAFSVVLSANAQYHHRHRITPPRSYHVAPTPPHFLDNTGDIRLHVAGELGLYDINNIFLHELPAHYSVGGMLEYQTSRFLSLGLGAEYYGIRHLDGKVLDQNYYLNCVPVYGNVRVNTTGFVNFFAEARVGYAFSTNKFYITNPNRNIAAQGFYTGAAVGIDVYGNNFSVGFNSVDIIDTDNNQPLYHNGSNRKVMATDFYLRYSYAIPLN